MANTQDREIRLDYIPFDKQKQFHMSNADECLYGGSTGGGKSVALLMEAFQRSIETPGHKSLVLRRTHKQLQRSLLRHLREFFPRNLGTFNKTDMVYKFPNGSVIDFGYLATEKDKYQYQGSEYDFVGFEELTQFKESQYLYLFSRIRSPNPDSDPVIRCTSNPGGVGHLWVKSRFIDPKPEGGKWTVKVDEDSEITREFIPATVFDNKYIVDNDPGYITRLKQLPEDEKQAYLHGDWNVFGGQVFKEFDVEHHVIPPVDIPSNWIKYMGIDWGYREPFAILWAAVAQEDKWFNNDLFVPKDGIIIYREYYGCPRGQTNKGIEKDGDLVAQDIVNREEEQVHIRIADHDMFAHRGMGPTIAEMFQAPGLGLYLQRADKGGGSRLHGKQQLHKRLRIQEKEDGTEFSYLYIVDNCHHLIRTLPNLPYDESKVEDVDTDAEDHLYDSLRYILQARPMAKKTRKKTTKRKKTNWGKYTGY